MVERSTSIPRMDHVLDLRKMRLCIADPPYPAFSGSGGTKSRANRWYGSGQRSKTDRPADFHPNASEWDNPERHRQLIEDLQRDFDGFAISTSPDGIAAYGRLPSAARIMAWVKPNACPGSHRLLSKWEAVILFPPIGRRTNRGIGAMSDVLIENTPGSGFRGCKPRAYTEWVLSAMGYQLGDTVVDLFPGSGSVGKVLSDTA